MVERFTMTIPHLSPRFQRRVYVALPEGYEEHSDARYPTLYMFDGHNVFFDEDAAFGTSWGMAHYMEESGAPLIVVAAEPSGQNRLAEYSPFTHGTEDLGVIRGRGRSTMDWYCMTLKPFVDARWRTLPDRAHTLIAGSSMGGLMSLFAATHYSEVFGAAACLSPSLWVHPEKSRRMIRTGGFPPHTLIYMDYGAEEMANHPDNYRALTGAARELLARDCDLTFRIVPGGTHSEASWAQCVPVFLRCLGF